MLLCKLDIVADEPRLLADAAGTITRAKAAARCAVGATQEPRGARGDGRGRHVRVDRDCPRPSTTDRRRHTNEQQRTDCDLYSEDLSAFYDGELEVKRSGEVEAHLQQCPACKAALSKMILLSRLLNPMMRRQRGSRRWFANLIDRLHQVEAALNPAKRHKRQ